MEKKKVRKQTAQQKLNNFLRSPLAKKYPLDVYAKIVLHALASYFYYKEECDPSISALSEYCGLCEKQIRLSLKLLDSLKLIEIISKNGTRSLYILKLPTVTDAEVYKKKSVRQAISQAVNKSGKTRYNSKTAVWDTGVTAVWDTGVH